MFKIPFINLKKQWIQERKILLKKIDNLFATGNWVGGLEIEKFERNICKITNKKYCIALNSGTDALTLALHILGVKRGDEVITASNSFIATVAAIHHLGATAKFVDVLEDQLIDPNEVEKNINKKTKVILPVHLNGKICQMDKLNSISKKYNIPLVEDAAQSIGAYFRGYPSGSFSKIACFSAHPLKNLNAMGDAGYMVTNDKHVFDLAVNLRNHGMTKNRNKVDHFGYVSRLDNMQALILNHRLKFLKKVVNKRILNAKLYIKLLSGVKEILLPKITKESKHSFHLFVIQVQNRKKLVEFLMSKGIQTAIHYPKPIHMQPAAKYLNYKFGDLPNTEHQSKKILSLPINQFLSKSEIEYICRNIIFFYKNI